MSAFRQLAQQKAEPSDDGMSRLMCTVKGCQNRWSVDVGRRLCGMHYGVSDHGYVSMANFTPMPGVDKGDSHDWARRILKVHEMGYKVSPASLAAARSVRISENRREYE